MKNALIYIVMAGLLISLIGWRASAQERIVIDGKKADWKGIEPMVTDPKDAGNERANLDIKAVYAALDEENLYLMIETYGAPSRKSGYSFDFDVNDDDKAEYYARFGNMLDFYHDGEGHIVGRAEPIIYDFRRLRIFRLKYVVGEVVEARVPLDYLGHPSVIVIRAKTNVWNLHPGQTLHRDYLDAACCGIIDLSLLRDEQPTRKNAGMGVITLFAGLAAAGGFMKRKK